MGSFYGQSLQQHRNGALAEPAGGLTAVPMATVISTTGKLNLL